MTLKPLAISECITLFVALNVSVCEYTIILRLII